MANITSVDYESIPGKTQQMKEIGQTLMNEIQGAYTDVENMHSVWYGKRYNELLGDFNNLVPKVNELIDLVWGEIPYTLEIVANNYAKADGVSIQAADRANPTKITELAIPSDTGMRFESSSVLSVRDSVVGKFNNAKNEMDQFQTVYREINWESDAARVFEGRFASLKSQVVEAFNTISNSFQRLMTETEEDIQSTETNNTVN